MNLELLDSDIIGHSNIECGDQLIRMIMLFLSRLGHIHDKGFTGLRHLSVTLPDAWMEDSFTFLRPNITHPHARFRARFFLEPSTQHQRSVGSNLPAWHVPRVHNPHIRTPSPIEVRKFEILSKYKGLSEFLTKEVLERGLVMVKK